MSTPESIESVKEGIQGSILEYNKKKPNEEKFTIEFNGKIAGSITISQLNTLFFEHKAKIDSCLHPDFRSKGIMTKVVKIITRYAFDKYRLKRIEAWCRTFNKGSRRVLEKSGFKLEGILRKNKIKDGKFLDDCVYAVVE